MVLIYMNEALSVIKRAVRSIITHTPKHLLKEIILVDDHSTYSKSSCRLVMNNHVKGKGRPLNALFHMFKYVVKSCKS